MTKEIPILFSTPMVQAILAGRKIMTRRIVKPQPTEFVDDPAHPLKNVPCVPGKKGLLQSIRCPYGYPGDDYEPGDLLWVRETSANLNADFDGIAPYYVYKADLVEANEYGPVIWKPSIHMPKAAARIWLEVRDIKVQRLQDISGTDVYLEGIDNGHLATPNGKPWENIQRIAFAELWNKINGNWDQNPWVWVVSFKVLSTTGRPPMTNDSLTTDLLTTDQ